MQPQQSDKMSSEQNGLCPREVEWSVLGSHNSLTFLFIHYFDDFSGILSFLRVTIGSYCIVKKGEMPKSLISVHRMLSAATPAPTTPTMSHFYLISEI